MPSFAATAATWRVWFDCTPPMVTRVSAVRGDGVGDDVLELADLVAPEREPRVAVVALGPDLDVAAERLGEPAELLDGRRPNMSG